MKVAENKKAQGYGVGIRQCHDCRHCEAIEGIDSIYKTYKYYCTFADFAVKKTGTCKEWKACD